MLWVGVFATGIYGGYFGAAQGVILLALLGIFIVDDLQRLNGVKNVLALIANGVAAIVFVVAANVDWAVAGLIALGSIVGGQVGAHVGRRIPAPGCCASCVVIGVVGRGQAARDLTARTQSGGRRAVLRSLSRTTANTVAPTSAEHESSTTQSPKRT